LNSSVLLASSSKSVCVEAGMIALREGAKELNHEHFHGGILEVAAKKKSDHFVSLISCSVPRNGR
jgi:ATP-dependent 26S proteasome regulatory subunit